MTGACCTGVDPGLFCSPDHWLKQVSFFWSKFVDCLLLNWTYMYMYLIDKQSNWLGTSSKTSPRSFSHFRLIFQMHWVNFNQTSWHYVFFIGKGDLCLFKRKDLAIILGLEWEHNGLQKVFLGNPVTYLFNSTCALNRKK